MTKHGSPEHFKQVTSAHVVLAGGRCRCGARVAPVATDYRAHIAEVWLPHQLPAGWMEP